MVQYDAQLQPLLDLVSDALASVVEAGRQINIYRDELESVPHRLATVGERLRAETDLPQVWPTLVKRSHYYQRIQAELQELNAR